MSARFIRRGISKFRFSATLDGASPTREELDASDDLTPFIADLAGWMLENNSVATPDMSSTFESSIPGTDQVADSSITCFEDLEEDTIEALLPKGTAGYFIILRKGDIPSSTSMDTFPVRVRSKGSEFNIGNEPARFVVQFAITDPPELDAAVPDAAESSSSSSSSSSS